MTDPSPLQTALAAKKFLPASNIEECRELLEVERLVPPHKVTVGQHQAFRESIAPRPPVDRIDEAVDAGPAQTRKASEVSRVLRILDELESEARK